MRPCTGRTAHRGSRGIALPFLDHGTRRGEESASRPGRSLPGKESVPIVQEAVCVLVGRLDKWLVVRWYQWLVKRLKIPEQLL